MCGEKAIRDCIVKTVEGSPPHVRGKGVAMRTSAFRLRITPACAGKRLMAVGALYCKRDHPRMCGEKTKKIP